MLSKMLASVKNCRAEQKEFQRARYARVAERLNALGDGLLQFEVKGCAGLDDPRHWVEVELPRGGTNHVHALKLSLTTDPGFLKVTDHVGTKWEKIDEDELMGHIALDFTAHFEPEEPEKYW